MFLKNNQARLITINGKLEEMKDGSYVRNVKFQLKPGNNPAVEVPDELCKTEYVKALLASGAVVQVQGDPSKPDLPGGGNESLYADFDKAQLTAQCEARDIEITSRDTKADLIAKLEASDE